MGLLDRGLGARWVAERLSRTIALLVLTIAGPVLVAGAGLLLEMHTGSDHFAPWVWGSRWLVTLVALAGSVYFLRVTRLQDRDLGTLYYVRLLEEWMSDHHADLLAERGSKYADERSITVSFSEQPQDGVTDLTHHVEEVRRRLADAIVTDRTDTGSHIAPNLIWPAAMGLGYGLQITRDTGLVEFGSKTIVWEPLGVTGGGFDPAVARRRARREERSARPRTVLIVARLTPAPAEFLPEGFGPDLVVEVGVAGDDGQLRPVTVDTDSSATVTPLTALVHPHQAAVAVSTAIRQVLSEFPEARVYLAARMPKSVALLVGYLLSGAASPRQDGGGPAASIRHPWSRLTPLTVDQNHPDYHHENPRPAVVAYRVHPGQPSAEQLRAALHEDSP